MNKPSKKEKGLYTRIWQLTLSVTMVIVLLLFVSNYSSLAKGMPSPKSQPPVRKVDPDSVWPDYGFDVYP